MVAKVFLLLCSVALFAQSITSQCIGAAYNGLGLDAAPWGAAAPWNALPYGAEAPLATAWAAGPCAATPYATAEWAIGYEPGFAPSNGGGFPIRSISPIAVTGVSMTSENIYEGPLAVSGAMPFLGAVSLEGALPTLGAGAVAYGCGNGNIAMVSEDFAGYGAYGPYGPGIAPELAYGYGGPLGYEVPLGYEAPFGYETGIAGPYGYGYNRDCGYGPLY